MNIQHLLIKLILQSKKFNLFHSLLQFHAFNDSNELAHILIDFDNNSLIQKDYKSKSNLCIVTIVIGHHMDCIVLIRGDHMLFGIQDLDYLIDR